MNSSKNRTRKTGGKGSKKTPRSPRSRSGTSSDEDNVLPTASNDNSDAGSSTQDALIDQEQPPPTAQNSDYEVEKVVDKKIYEGQVYYKLKWVGWDEPTWELAENCSCDLLISNYEKMVEEQSKDEDEDEWEVEEILDKRTRQNETEYLVRWKNWTGEPTWVNEKNCACINLIAAFENPKLRKMWNFHGSNTKLWLNHDAMIRYMRNYAKINGFTVNILEFEPDFPSDEQPVSVVEGLNMGPLCYKNHWYLVIILVNYICITKKVLICDPLNTLIGVPNTRVHPVYKRVTKVYKNYTVTPVVMTPMERSDMCAFYVLAGYERALFCLNKDASFIINKLYFDHSRPELIRAQTSPGSNHEISVNLPNNGSFLDGPKCEFCGILGETGDVIDRHIRDEHFTKATKPRSATSPSKRKKDGEMRSQKSRKHFSTELPQPVSLSNLSSNRRMSS